MLDLIQGEADKRVRPLQSVSFFVVFFLVSCGFAASQEIIVTTPGFKPLHRSFLTLSSLDVLAEANDTLQQQRLAAIVDSGESEAGQQVRKHTFNSTPLPTHILP